MKEFLIHFIIGGFLISFITYISNNVDPILGGLITGIPLGIFTIFFITNSNTSQQFAFVDLFSTIIMTVVTLIFYYAYAIIKIKKSKALFFSIILWIVLTFIILELLDRNKELKIINKYIKKLV